jgi:regulator of replication initiation timing
MEPQLKEIIGKLKEERLLNNILRGLNLSSYNDLIQLIENQIYSYINDLRVFLTRLFEICYDKPLHEFNKLPLEVLLFIVSEKSNQLKKCYPILVKNQIYIRLKKIPTEEEYEKLLKILAIIGVNIGKLYQFKNKYEYLLTDLKIIRDYKEKIVQKKNIPYVIDKKKIFLFGFLSLLIGSSVYLYSEINTFKLKIQELEKENQKLKNQNAELEIKVHKFEKENRQLKNEISNLRTKIETLVNENKQLKNENSKLKMQIEK